MSNKKIVFQGEPGANSHLAIREAYPELAAVPCASFEDAFAAVAGEAELAMIPIENSVAGRVADIHHLMPERPAHRRRTLRADPPPVAGYPRRHASRTSRRTTATSRRSASAARSSASSASSR